MKNTVKAILLNALLLPGLGQLALGKKARGWVYISIMIVAFIMFARFIYLKVTGIVADLDLSESVPDVATISQKVSDSMASDGSPIAMICLLTMVAVWVISIIDAIITGSASRHHSGDKLPGAGDA